MCYTQMVGQNEWDSETLDKAVLHNSCLQQVSSYIVPKTETPQNQTSSTLMPQFVFLVVVLRHQLNKIYHGDLCWQDMTQDLETPQCSFVSCSVFDAFTGGL